MPATGPDRFALFVDRFTRLIDQGLAEPDILKNGAVLLADLVGQVDWLPDAWAQPDPARYQQYLLHLDPAARFSVVSFVWGPGQATPIHDHMVWGLVGVLRGAETSQAYTWRDEAFTTDGLPQRLAPGAVEAISPRLGDIHQVANAVSDQISVSIHVYGADIGTVRRSIFDRDGQPRRFVSGYANRAATSPASASAQNAEALP
ncbi:cysteine dioxygenase [soil metagenome]